jgi:SAM-dependent methyltransferase
MGINVNNLRFLVRAKLRGADFAKTMMLGRQGLHLSHRQFSGVLLGEFGLKLSPEAVRAAYDREFAEGLFELLGAHTVHSIDYSDFQDATHVADLNRLLPAELHGGYTAVVDGGTLEHVFHFPAAIESCMRLLAVGGHFVGLTIANNFAGHGFYQFSPELFYRVFSPENGFSVVEMYLHEGRESRVWRRALDPDTVSRRIVVRNGAPTGLLVLARRSHQAEPFAVAPQQSFYKDFWAGSEIPRPGLTRKIYHALPGMLKVLASRAQEIRLRRVLMERVNPASVAPE